MDPYRRIFLKTAVAFLAAAPCTAAARLCTAYKGEDTPRMSETVPVVISQRPQVVRTDGNIDGNLLSTMVASSVCRLTNVSSVAQAWRSLFSPSEIIGIKVNAMGGPLISTCAVLAYTVATQLIEAGIPQQNIIIWDRLSSELERAGYTIRRTGTGIRCFGTDSDYETRIEQSGTVGTCFSRIITSCDALINIPVLKDHDLSGVSLGLKNFYGAIHNPNKYHDNGCDPFIADLNTHPYIRKKLRLTIIDGMHAQYNGGPAYRRQWQWPYAGIIVGRDPVAVDTVGTSVIEKKRKEEGLPSLTEAGRPAVHVHRAAERGLGCDDLKKINLIYI